MTRDFVHHRRRFGDTETRTAVFFGHRDTEPAAIGHRLVKRMRKHAVFVTREPVIVVEPGYDCANALANGVQFLHGRRRSYSVHHRRSDEHTSELQSLMRHSYAVFCLKKKKNYQ